MNEIKRIHWYQAVHRVGILSDVTSKEVAAVGWIVTAGLYGYLSRAYTGADAAPYPQDAHLFLFLGIAIGVAFSASIVAAERGDDSE